MAPFNLYRLELFSIQHQDKAVVKNDRDIFYHIMDSYANHTTLDRELTQLAQDLPSSSFSVENFFLYDHSSKVKLDTAFLQRARAVFKERIIVFNAYKPEEEFNRLIANITATVPNYPKAKIDARSTRQFFITTVQIKATWSTPFLASLTALQPFYIEDEDYNHLPYDNNVYREEEARSQWFKHSYTLVDTMQVYARFPYTEYDKWTLIDLPLRAIGGAPLHCNHHDDYIMSIVLPRDHRATLDKMTTPLDWLTIVSRQMETVPSRDLHLHMPRFCINNFIQFDNPSDQGETVDTDLIPLFQQVGIRVQEGGLGVNTAQADPMAPEAINSTLVVKINRSFSYLIWHPKTQLTLLAGWVRHFYARDNSVYLCPPLDQ